MEALEILSEDEALAFTISAAEALVPDGFVIEPVEFLNSLDDLMNRVGDVVHVLCGSEKMLMREPDGFVIGSAVGFRARMHISKIERLIAPPAQRWEIRGIYGKKRALIDRFIEKAITGNTLKLKSSNEGGARDILGLLLKIFDHVAIGRETRNPRIGFKEANRGGTL